MKIDVGIDLKAYFSEMETEFNLRKSSNRTNEGPLSLLLDIGQTELKTDPEPFKYTLQILW